MKKVIFLSLFCSALLSADSLEHLLREYQTASDHSLKTVDEKIGHVIVYTQEEIRLMQYRTLNDILKELPLFNVNTNRFGLTNHSLTGSKTTTSGFFRFFINDHELSSGYDQSTSLSWGDMTLDFVDHIEIYYGESSLSFGNETGIYFIRIYTKSAQKENGSSINAFVASNGASSQSFTHAQSFENGWSYLMFANRSKIEKTTDYKTQTLNANAIRHYLYLDARNENDTINMGYADVRANNYAGLSFDAIPDSGKMTSRDLFLDYTHYFLEDRSLKADFSVDINDRTYNEANAQGIALIPVLDFSNLGMTIPKNFYENLSFVKTNAYFAKTFTYEENSFITGVNFQQRSYDVKERTTTNFLNQTTDVGRYNDFKKESIASLLLQDSYQLRDDLILVANAKWDKHRRNGSLNNISESLFRVGAIYTPVEYFGLKSFYTQTSLAPSFYNIDYAAFYSPDLKSQQYKFYTVEAAFTAGESKFSVTYDHVNIDDFIYLAPVGFINVDHTIKTQGWMFDYEYNLPNNDKLHLNYYTSSLSETINNSTKGGYVKYMGSYLAFDYFTSLIYKNAYSYQDINVPSSYDVNLGLTYHVNKDLSCSIKVTNLLNKSTRSLYQEGIGGTNFALEDDHDRSVYLSFKWGF
jgi:iron complex outermembrane receptor protein